MIPYSMHSIGEEEIRAVNEVLRSGCLTGGPRVEMFEAAFADYVGAKHAVAVNSCAAALYLALRAHFPGRGAIIALPTLTYAATANAVVMAGHIPRLVDIDPGTFCIAPDRIPIEADGVIPVHYAGHPCDLDAIQEAGDWVIIEDAAHACGAEYKGKKIGARNTVCFSFHPCKNMTTAEGGMITTNDPFIVGKIGLGRLNGIQKDGIYQDMVTWGFKFNMNEIQAAIGIEQLKKLDEMNLRRRKIADKYVCVFQEEAWDKVGIPDYTMPGVHSHHLFPILVNNRDEVAKKLQSKAIQVAIHYKPIHLMTWYQKNFGYKEGDFPVAEEVARHILSIPIYPDMTDEQVDYVIQTIKEAV